MIAVTGANGLLGSFIVQRLAENRVPVTAIVRKGCDMSSLLSVKDEIVVHEADVLDMPALGTALEGMQTVIHTAAMVSFNPRRANRIQEINVDGTRNVVDACLNLSIPKIIHISSVAALGRQKGGGVCDEESKWVDSDLNTDYAESKYLSELELWRGQEEGLDISMVNPSVILAPSDWTKSSSQIFRYAWDENLFYMKSSINCVDVRDVVDMVLTLIGNNFSGQRFIANAGTFPVYELLGAIAKRFNKRPPQICVNDSLTGIAARFEELRCFLTGREPVITRQSVRMAKETFIYANDKATRVMGIKFRSLEETLDWCCTAYLRKININNQ